MIHRLAINIFRYEIGVTNSNISIKILQDTSRYTLLPFLGLSHYFSFIIFSHTLELVLNWLKDQFELQLESKNVFLLGKIIMINNNIYKYAL